MPLKERKSNRWKGFNYASENAYFITICVNERLGLLGNIVNGKMQLSELGMIVEKCWNDLPNHYPNCILDEFIIMPNHVHGIITIDNSVFDSVGNGLRPFPTNLPTNIVGEGLKPSPTHIPNDDTGKGLRPSLTNTSDDAVGNGFKPFPTRMHGLSEMVRAFKSFSSRRINELKPNKKFVWQKSFHDHVIRDLESLLKIQQYIISNPSNWEKDTYFIKWPIN